MKKLYFLTKNTAIFYGVLFKKFFLFFLSLFKKTRLLQRYDLLIDVNASLSELPKNSWYIRRIIVMLSVNKTINLTDQIEPMLLLLRAQFPTKKMFIQYDSYHDFNAIEFLRLLSCDDLESKLNYCLKFSNHIALNYFLEKYRSISLYQSGEIFSKILLNKKITWLQCVIILVLTILSFSVFFKIVYDKNVQGLSLAKLLSQQLVQVCDNNKLSDVQRFHVFQEYYFFSRKFLKKNTVLAYTMEAPVTESMENLVFTIIQKQYSQRVIHDIKSKLIVFQNVWDGHKKQNNKNNRGEYYAYWLAYLDLLYPDHLIVSAVDFQVKAVVDIIAQSAISASFVDDYLRHLQKRQLLPTVLVADEFFMSIKKQLQDDGVENLFAFIYFLESKKLGFVSLDCFVKKTDILMSDEQLPAIFLKENFIGHLLPELKNISDHDQYYTWFIGPVLQDNGLLFDALRQKFIMLDKKSWQDFLSTIYIRPTSNLLLASHFLELLMDDHGDFRQLLTTVSQNLSVDDFDDHNEINWLEYKKALGFLYQDSHYILLNDNTGVASKDYAVAVLTKGDTHLNAAAQQVKSSMIDVPDLTLAIGLQDYLLAPIKFYWTTLLVNAKETVNQQYHIQVLSYYQQYLQHKFPFAQSMDDADPENVKRWLAPQSGLFWQFLQNNLKGFVMLNNTWQRHTWLGIGLSMQNQFIDKTNQLWQFANDIFKQDDYGLDLVLYPVPSPLIEHEILTIHDALFDYQNGPQTWQSFLWQPGSADNLLKIQYVSPDPALTKKFTGPWGLLRFLADPDLEKPSLHLLVKPEDLVPVLRELPQNNELVLTDEG